MISPCLWSQQKVWHQLQVKNQSFITGVTATPMPINSLHIHYRYHATIPSCSAIKSSSKETNHSVSHLAILSLQDMVSSLSPCNTPSHVWIVVVERTGMVPSPDSIFVRSCPLALRFGCLSPWSKWQKSLTISWETFWKCFTDSITIRRVN